MKFLKDLFNRQVSVFVPLAALAEIAAPVHPAALDDHSPANVAAAWREMADWTRIGFELETHKGTAYDALSIVLRHIEAQIARAAPDAEGVYIRKEDMRVLRATYWQMGQSADGLRQMARTQKKRPETRYQFDEHGRTWAVHDYSNVIQIYNRPDADHARAAQWVLECQRRLDTLFERKTVRPAPDATVSRYAAMTKYYR
jgi:hypothetical protein